MDNKGLLRGVIILLVISVGMNIMTYKKTQNVEQKVQALNNQDSRTEQIVNSSLSQMHNTLSQIKQQGDWISPVSLDVGKELRDSTTIKLSWQIKEYPVGAPVILYYQLDKNQPFTPINAVSTGGGNFTGEMQVDKTFQEPEWHISYSGESDYLSRPVMVQDKTSLNSQLTCYITMQDGSKLFTSEKTIHNISKISQMTGPLDVHVHYRKRECNITLMEIDNMTEIKIKSARLKIKKSPTETTEIPFTKRKDPNEPVSLYEAAYTAPDQTIPELTLCIIYDNGEIVEKQL